VSGVDAASELRGGYYFHRALRSSGQKWSLSNNSIDYQTAMFFTRNFVRINLCLGSTVSLSRSPAIVSSRQFRALASQKIFLTK